MKRDQLAYKDIFAMKPDEWRVFFSWLLHRGAVESFLAEHYPDYEAGLRGEDVWVRRKKQPTVE